MKRKLLSFVLVMAMIMTMGIFTINVSAAAGDNCACDNDTCGTGPVDHSATGTPCTNKVSTCTKTGTCIETLCEDCGGIHASCTGAPVVVVSYPFVYDNSNLTIKEETNTSTSAAFFYVVKYDPAKAEVTATNNAAKAEKYLNGLKWFPIYGTAIDVSKFVPKAPPAEGKQVYVGIVDKAGLLSGANFANIKKVELPARAVTAKANKEFTVKYVGDDVKIEVASGANVGAGLEYKVELGTTWSVIPSAGLTISMADVPFGAAMEIRVKSGAYTFPAKGKTPEVEVLNAAYSTPAKVKIAVPAKGPSLKLDASKTNGIAGIKAGQQYRLWTGAAWGTWTDLEDKATTLDDLKATVAQDGLSLVQVRTKAPEDGKKPPSAPAIFDVTPAPTATATGNLTEVKDAAITPYDITVTLTGNLKFIEILDTVDCSKWIGNLPAGLKATPKATVAADAITMTITISGIPTAVKDANITVKIPKASVTNAAKDISMNVMNGSAQAKFVITAPVSP